jgi:hypothetical protein
MTATMIYTIEGRRHTQTFTAFEMDDERLSELATSLGCVVDEVLGQHRMWVRLRRQAAPRTSDRFLTRDEETP